MLSGETAVGSYPIESIQVMNRICKEAELDVASSLRAMAAAGAVGDTMGNGDLRRWVGGGMPGGVVLSEGGALRDAFAKSAILAARETGKDFPLCISSAHVSDLSSFVCHLRMRDWFSSFK